MNIVIETAVNLDPVGPSGSKNLQLLLSCAGIRSQIDFLGLTKAGKKWQVNLFLERPEYWGDELALLKEDLDGLVLTADKKPYPMMGQYKISQKELNISSDNASDVVSEKAL